MLPLLARLPVMLKVPAALAPPGRSVPAFTNVPLPTSMLPEPAITPVEVLVKPPDFWKVAPDATLRLPALSAKPGADRVPEATLTLPVLLSWMGESMLWVPEPFQVSVPVLLKYAGPPQRLATGLARVESTIKTPWLSNTVPLNSSTLVSPLLSVTVPVLIQWRFM